MKWFASISSSARFVSNMMGRRRERQGTPRVNMFTVELAEAHVRALVAMAAADGRVDASEIDEVLAYLDRVSLAAGDVSALRGLVPRLVTAPPLIDDVVAPLAGLAVLPGRARALVTDLARVAAASHASHPRQQLLMGMVCEQLGVANPLAPRLEAEAPDPATPGRLAPRTTGTDQRIRESVCRALDQMYVTAG